MQSHKELQGVFRYSVLLLSFTGDKRLDEWVQQSRLSPLITKAVDQMDVLTPRLSTMASLNA